MSKYKTWGIRTGIGATLLAAGVGLGYLFFGGTPAPKAPESKTVEVNEVMITGENLDRLKGMSFENQKKLVDFNNGLQPQEFPEIVKRFMYNGVKRTLPDIDSNNDKTASQDEVDTVLKAYLNADELVYRAFKTEDGVERTIAFDKRVYDAFVKQRLDKKAKFFDTDEDGVFEADELSSLITAIVDDEEDMKSPLIAIDGRDIIYFDMEKSKLNDLITQWTEHIDDFRQVLRSKYAECKNTLRRTPTSDDLSNWGIPELGNSRTQAIKFIFSRFTRMSQAALDLEEELKDKYRPHDKKDVPIRSVTRYHASNGYALPWGPRVVFSPDKPKEYKEMKWKDPVSFYAACRNTFCAE